MHVCYIRQPDFSAATNCMLDNIGNRVNGLDTTKDDDVRSDIE